MSSTLGDQVGYAVRFDESTSPSTKIKYLTGNPGLLILIVVPLCIIDGTLLRECLSDSKLEKYSVLMLDEAHERSLNTDVLFGVVKSLLTIRTNLKVLITSATLDSAKFSEYFYNCPVINVEGTCFPVSIIYSKENHLQHYVQAAVDVVLDIHCHKPEGDILLFLTGQAEICKTVENLTNAVEEMPSETCSPLQVLPLYAALPLQKQSLVFSPTPPGCRRCVVATNVAETSLTVDGIVYVVDPGTVKQKIYNSHSCMDSLQVVTISHVQAKQRAGRAGRTREGMVRLISFYESLTEMKDVSLPEIQRTSLVSTVLYLKSLEMDIDVLNFDFLDKPEMAQLEDALRQLFVLDAIDEDGQITPLGKKMTKFPLDPSLSRALVAAADAKCASELLIIASMLSVENIFQESHSVRKLRENGENEFIVGCVNEGLGDHFALLKIYTQWSNVYYSREWCKEQGLDYRSMRSVHDIHRQLSHMVEGYESEFDSEDEVQVSKREELKPERGKFRHKSHHHHHHHETTVLSISKHSRLKRVLTLGFANRIAHRMAMHNGYRPLNPNAPLCELHPSCSKLRPDADGLLPEWIIYHEIIETSRPFLTKVCPVDGSLVDEIVRKLRNVDVHRLSGGKFRTQAITRVESNTLPVEPEMQSAIGVKRKHSEETLSAARQRYLNRKAKRK
eukprot:g787.t1